jgi:photosystem II stability/assembly factor-like uncharacterized protein
MVTPRLTKQETKVEFPPSRSAPIWLEGIYMILFIFLVAQPMSANGQWRLLARPGGAKLGGMRSIYFLDFPGPPRVGFVGIYRPYGADDLSKEDAGIWKTVDGGVSWRKVKFHSDEAYVTQFCFKDSLTGWCSIDALNADEGLWKTTDGGETWKQLISDIGTAVYYHVPTKLLFFSTLDAANVSTDDGTTWSKAADGWFQGLAFTDDMHGYWNNTVIPNQSLVTSDGGLTWFNVNTHEDFWQPLAIKGTATLYGCADVDGDIFRSTDYGVTWTQISHISTSFDSSLMGGPAGAYSGDVELIDSCLITQTGAGFVESSDGGFTWYAIGGPAYASDNRFYVRGHTIYAYSGSSIWVNDNAGLPVPHVPLVVQGNTTVGVGDPVHVNIWTGEITAGLFVGVDSVNFDLIYNPNVLEFVSDSTNAGFKITSRVSVSSGRIHYSIRHLDILQIVDSLLLDVGFRAIASLDSASNIRMSGLHYSNWVNWMGCMPQPPADEGSDSIVITVSGGCSTNLLREFLRSGKIPFDILNVSPNPASSLAKLRIKNEFGLMLHSQLFDELGVLKKSLEVTGSESTLDVSDLPNGVYYLRVSQSGFVQSRKVVVSR